MPNFNQFEKSIHNRNFYKFEGKSYYLFAKGVTPNGCWLIAPEMREVTDIDVATGKHIFSGEVYKLEVTGDVPSSCVYQAY